MRKRGEKRMLWILGGAAVLALLLLALACLSMGAVFGRRCEGDPELTYFTQEDFPGLEARPAEFPSNRGQLLRGAIYTRRERPAGLVVFAHGMGGGHRSYMTEINTLAGSGFAVLAYDNTGTMASQGRSLGGFYQAVRDLRSALAFVRGSPEWSGCPVVLVGHSWGGYAVCQALAFEEKAIAGAVAFSPPDSAAGALCAGLKGMTGIPMGWMRPAFWAASVLRDGWDARRSGTSILTGTDVPVLLLHGDADRSVPLPYSPLSSAAVRGKANITALVYEGRGHNVYQTAESEKYLGDVMNAIAAAKKRYGRAGIPTEEKTRLYSIDYQLITQEDASVMETVTAFIKGCLEEA